MEYRQVEYGYTNELAFIFIPNSMQKVSNFKKYDLDQKLLCHVDVSVEDIFIVLKFKSTSPREKTNNIASDNTRNKLVRPIDMFGRIPLPLDCAEQIKMSSKDMLILYLIDENTIKIRTSNIKNENEPYISDFTRIGKTSKCINCSMPKSEHDHINE